MSRQVTLRRPRCHPAETRLGLIEPFDPNARPVAPAILEAGAELRSAGGVALRRLSRRRAKAIQGGPRSKHRGLRVLQAGEASVSADHRVGPDRPTQSNEIVIIGIRGRPLGGRCVGLELTDGSYLEMRTYHELDLTNHGPSPELAGCAGRCDERRDEDARVKDYPEQLRRGGAVRRSWRMVRSSAYASAKAASSVRSWLASRDQTLSTTPSPRAAR